MGRYSKANVLQSKIDKENEQKRLKKKHSIEDNNIIVIEKNNIFKFTVKTVILLIRAITGITLFCLAAIGIFTLLYSDLRQVFISILSEIFNSVFGGF